MKILGKSTIKGISSVYIAETENKDGLIEFVDVEPVIDEKRIKKWVIILSTQIGCPASCIICDAGGSFLRNLSLYELIFQVNYLVRKRKINTTDIEKLKIQFARMGEPSLNDAVIEAIVELKKLYDNCIPCVSTIAPLGREKWFNELNELRDEFYDFQMQFSIFTTDKKKRDEIIKFPIYDLDWISNFGEKFFRKGKRKIILNFPVNGEFPIDTDKINRIFSKESFIVKFTPINPTEKVKEQNILTKNYCNIVEDRIDEIICNLDKMGFDTIKSIGEMKENIVGSNCGQSVVRMKMNMKIDNFESTVEKS